MGPCFARARRRCPLGFSKNEQDAQGARFPGIRWLRFRLGVIVNDVDEEDLTASDG